MIPVSNHAKCKQNNDYNNQQDSRSRGTSQARALFVYYSRITWISTPFPAAPSSNPSDVSLLTNLKLKGWMNFSPPRVWYVLPSFLFLLLLFTFPLTLTRTLQDELYDYCNKVKRTVFEVMSEFRHVQVPKEYIFDVFPPMRPRQFSIASALEVCFSPFSLFEFLS